MVVKNRMITVATVFDVSLSSISTIFEPPKFGRNSEITTLVWPLISGPSVYRRQSIGVSAGKVHK
ncbi:hypothetical protein Har1130_19135 [Haloarcula sp. CBA1130]|nr:hypothetical protein Har1130_19135 [Haloarcula sp. CBA1130]KAA9397544.1 hypothetical protein Har1129_04480 [Haloarcula sp. CBA1129]